MMLLEEDEELAVVFEVVRERVVAVREEADAALVQQNRKRREDRLHLHLVAMPSVRAYLRYMGFPISVRTATFAGIE